MTHEHHGEAGTPPSAGSNADPHASRLSRRLGTTDAVVVGVAAMVGAGVFAAFAPAAAAAGSWLLLGLCIAAVVAYANASTTATLAAAMPTSGGGYAFARTLLSPTWGFVAGWAFLAGKTASAAAMALTFGAYVYEPWARPLAVAVVVAVTVVNHFGVSKTALASRVIVAFVLAVLAFVIAASLTASGPQAFTGGPPLGVYGVLQSAGILFFAFAGYARLATLGEEVRDPQRTIPKAVTISLAVVLIVYAAVGWTALRTLGPVDLAESAAPLRDVVERSAWSQAAVVVTVGAAAATLGVLLSLTAGMGRTAFAMAADGELPARLALVDPRHRVPQFAGLVIGGVVIAAVLLGDLRQAIGFSSFAILTYYAIGHVAVRRLPDSTPRRQVTAAVGLIGCALMALTLPVLAAVAAAVVVAGGGILHATLRRS